VVIQIIFHEREREREREKQQMLLIRGLFEASCDRTGGKDDHPSNLVVAMTPGRQHQKQYKNAALLPHS